METITYTENENINWDLNKLEFNYILNIIAGYALSETGKEKLLKLKPDTSYDNIIHSHILQDELRSYFIYEERISINNIFIFGEFVKKTLKNVIMTGEELYQLAHSVKIYFTLREYFSKDKYKNLLKEFSIPKLGSNFYLEILKYIDNTGYVDSRASKELGRIRDMIASVEEKIKKATGDFYKSAKSNNYLASDIVSMRDGFSCLSVKNNFKNKIDGIVLDYSSTGQTVYVVPNKVLELHNEILVLKQDEQVEVNRILRNYCEIVKNESESLIIIDNELLKFDMIYSIGRYCRDKGYTSPKVTHDGFVKIINGKHPIIGEKAVPLNLEIGSTYKILVITGPNTGGKTVVLKTVGLFILMTQSGIGIPADPNSVMPVFDGVFIDIGDEQSISESLSTFSAHLKKIINIIKYANEKTIVLIDEMGAGTDPMEGSALAVSILKYLRNINAISIVSTHYSALKHLATNEDGFENGSMEFDVENMAPTYKLRLGIPGSSRAFDISRKLGMPSFILDNAAKYIDGDYVNIDSLLAKLEKEKIKVDEIKDRLTDKEKELEGKEASIAEYKQKLTEQEKELKRLFKIQESGFLSDAKKQFEQIVKDIKTSKAAKEEILSGKNFFAEFEKSIDNNYTEPGNPDLKNVKFSKGDKVFIKTSETEGFIIDKANSSDEYIVQAGILKVTVKSEDLNLLKNDTEVLINQKNVSGFRPSLMSLTLDLRGNRWDEAENKLGKFIEDAASSNVKLVKVIHGKGTGALIKCVKNLLDTSNLISGYDYENIPNVGKNFGVTVVNLK